MGNQQRAEETKVVWFYSFDQPGWYSPKYNTSIPGDAVPVAEATMLELKEGLAVGQILVKGQDGAPCLADRPPPSNEELAARERRWRDQQLQLTDSLVARHRDEREAGGAVTLAEDEYAVLQDYRGALRAWPEAKHFPHPDHRPAPPTSDAN